MIRELICINCPKGCRVKVDTDTMEVTGYSCDKGISYAISEVTAPKRTVTSTVVIKNAIFKRLPVKSNGQIDKDLVSDVVRELNKIQVSAPVKAGDVIIKNVLNTKIDIISTQDM